MCRQPTTAPLLAGIVLGGSLLLLSGAGASHTGGRRHQVEVVGWSADGRSCLVVDRVGSTAGNEQLIYQLISVRPGAATRVVLSDWHEQRRQQAISSARCRARLQRLRARMRRLGFSQVKTDPAGCRAHQGRRDDLIRATLADTVAWQAIYEGGARIGMTHGRLRALASRCRILLLLDDEIHYQAGGPAAGSRCVTRLNSVRATMARSGHLLLLFGSSSLASVWLEAALSSPSGRPEHLAPIRLP